MSEQPRIPQIGRATAELEELMGDFAASRTLIRSMRAKANERRTLFEKIADRLRSTLGSVPMLILHILAISLWIIVNSGLIPGVEIFDPFPFFFLGFIVATEALLLALVVLISQNRSEKITELRQEINLQMSIIAEEETTKLMHMVNLLLQQHGIDITHDTDLKTMLKPTNIEKIEQTLEQEVMDD